MVQVVKLMGRFIISIAVCAVVLFGLIKVFLPNLVEQTDITVETVQFDEPTVIHISANEASGPDISLSYVLESIASKNITEQLDEQFWKTARIEIGRVFTYKESNSAFVHQEFEASTASNWMFIFTSSNSLNEEYKVKINLRLN